MPGLTSGTGSTPAVRWSGLIGRLLDLVFPPLCHHCRAFIPDAGQVHLCDRCLAELTPVGSPLCSSCGMPFATIGGSDHRCGPCQIAPPPFQAARAALRFDGVARELIRRFKYQRRIQLRRPLALLTASQLAPFVAEFQGDLLLPVPLHRRRLRQRGFNQAVLLGEVLASQWRLPLDRTNLCRIRWTEPQVNLSAAERTRNVRGAFALAYPEEMHGKRIILVDDVYTTGSTVRECATVLTKEGKAAAVGVVTVARAIS